ncbi:MAG: hypothetical protein JOS17DRAFT_690932 [Linnemannia elongata]|nr:MAG: hypothetical protein JOS17DRAFT_690932 [Linnemannia elongata]
MLINPTFWKTYFTPPHFTNDMIPDLTGKVAIVTGANGGVGYATTVALAAHGARVFMACRSEARAKEAMDRVRHEIERDYPLYRGGVKLDFLELDLGDLTKVYQSAQAFLKEGLPLHILINNSGVAMSPVKLSADGLEYMFAVNHLGHFVFTLALLDRIKESQPSRIVNVSSWGHDDTRHTDGIDFTILTNPSRIPDLVHYGRSKLANILFTKALARRLTNEHVYVNALHPGHVSTNMAQTGRGSFGGNLFATVTELMGMSPKKGALTQLYCATSPEIENMDLRGRFFIPFGVESRCNPLAEKEDLQEKLWEISEKLMKEKVQGLAE